MKKNKYKKALTIAFLSLILILFTSMTYSFLNIYVNNLNQLQADLTSGTTSLIFEDGDNVINTSLKIGETVTKKFKITNSGSIESFLSIEWNNLINTYLDGSLTYNLTQKTDDTEIELITKTNIPTSNTESIQTLADIISIPANTTYYYNLNITFNHTDFNQQKDLTAVFQTNFSINQFIKSRNYTTNYYLMNIDGSTYTLESSSTNTADYNSEITEEPKNFDGFDTPPAQTIKIGVNENKIDYYYTRKKYTLTINPNGGDYIGETTITKYYEESVAVAPPSRTGYDFSWNKTGEGNLSGTTFTMGNGDATLTANWKAKTFTITYNANGGSPSTQSRTVTYDSTYILASTPTRSGFNFLGWYTSTGSGTRITSSTVVKLSSNQTLYAHWSQIYTTTFSSLGSEDDKENAATATSACYYIKNYTGKTFVYNSHRNCSITSSSCTNTNSYAFDCSSLFWQPETGTGSYNGYWYGTHWGARCTVAIKCSS